MGLTQKVQFLVGPSLSISCHLLTTSNIIENQLYTLCRTHCFSKPLERTSKQEEEEEEEEKKNRDMEGEEQLNKSRVIKVDSMESWNFYVTQATNQLCPIVVHFTASWCIPSVVMNSFFEELASTFQDVLFLIVDVDEVKEVASKMEVKAMPTFVLMKEGVQVDKLVGANPEEIRKRIDAFVQSVRVYVA